MPESSESEAYESWEGEEEQEEEGEEEFGSEEEAEAEESDDEESEEGSEGEHGNLLRRADYDYGGNASDMGEEIAVHHAPTSNGRAVRYANFLDGIDSESDESASDSEVPEPLRGFLPRDHVEVWERSSRSADVPTSTDLRQGNQAAYDQGIHILIDQWLRENDGYGILKRSHDRSSTAVTISGIILTMFPNILEALLAGNLPECFHQDGHKDLRRVLHQNYDRATGGEPQWCDIRAVLREQCLRSQPDVPRAKVGASAADVRDSIRAIVS